MTARQPPNPPRHVPARPQLGWIPHGMEAAWHCWRCGEHWLG